jgi:hypothetical protein
VALDECRRDVLALAGAVRRLRPSDVVALGELGPAGVAGWLARWPGVLRWLDVRAMLLATAFAELGEAIKAASRRTVEFGSDVFPPSVALLGGQDYARWAQSATFFTGGFGPRIGWGSVGRVAAASLGELLAGMVPGLPIEDAQRTVAHLLGATTDLDATLDEGSLLRELARIAAVRGDIPVYPPIAGPPAPDALARICDAIVEAGLDGAMVAGMEAATPTQRRVLRAQLAEPLASAGT